MSDNNCKTGELLKQVGLYEMFSPELGNGKLDCGKCDYSEACPHVAACSQCRYFSDLESNGKVIFKDEKGYCGYNEWVLDMERAEICGLFKLKKVEEKGDS